MKNKHMQAGIAMIELIFAIVIMGIAFLAAPQIISTATRSAYVAMQQESIAAASSEIGMILTYHWDEKDTDQVLSAPILQAAGDIELNEVLDVDGNGTGRRAGTPLTSKRSFLTSLGGRLNASTVLGDEGGGIDDIDDFNNNTSSLSIYNSEASTTETGDYIDTDITINTTVSYLNDTPTLNSYSGGSSTITLDNPFNRAATTATSNIKFVNIELTTNSTAEELSKSIMLNAFSCNIGTYELDERNF